MAYRLKLKEPIAEGVRRVGLEQIEIAETKLATDEDVPAAVHDRAPCLSACSRCCICAAGLDHRLPREATTRRICNCFSARDRYVSGRPGQALEASRVSAEVTAARLQLVTHGIQATKACGPRRSSALARLNSAHVSHRQALAISSSATSAQASDHLHEGRRPPQGLRQPIDEAFHLAQVAQRIMRHIFCSPMVGPLSWLARAGEPRSVPLLGETTIIRSCLRSRTSKKRDPARDVWHRSSQCRSRRRAQSLAKPRGYSLLAGATRASGPLALYWSSPPACRP